MGVYMLLQTPRDVGAALRDRRRRLGLDQAELARRVGVSRKWVVDAEKGHAGAGIGLILRAFAALGEGLAVAGTSAPPTSVPPIDAPDIDDIVDGHSGVQP